MQLEHNIFQSIIKCTDYYSEKGDYFFKSFVKCCIKNHYQPKYPSDVTNLLYKSFPYGSRKIDDLKANHETVTRKIPKYGFIFN